MEKSLIIINNNIYKKFDIEVNNIKYKTKNFYTGEINEGYSPCFEFNICDKIFIQIETMLLERKLENLSIGKNINIKKYITDILYKNESEWEYYNNLHQYSWQSHAAQILHPNHQHIGQ